jgi:hypothetical protein
MKITQILLAAAAAAFFAAPAFAAGMAPTEKSAVAYEDTFNKIFMAKDVKAMDAILSDDWVGQDDSGRMTKAQFMASFKAGEMTATSMTNQNVMARTMGDMVIVQGGDTEKSAFKGKDTSGSYIWTDILVSKNGKLMSIASQVTKLKAPMK